MQVEPATDRTAEPAKYFDASAATEERIRALEAAVGVERNARQLLEDELQMLYFEIERLSEQRPGIDERRIAMQGLNAELVRERELRFRAARSPEGRAAQLVEQGIAPDRAEWIIQRESELRMEALQAQFDARRTGQFDRSDPRLNPEAALRAEIGDAEYEQYLAANGRPTAIAVGTVIDSSPGHRAGLQSGDQIIRYDGQRIFSSRELTDRTIHGEPGQTIVVDIMRDGMPMQLVMPRGPIGITTDSVRRSR